MTAVDSEGAPVVAYCTDATHTAGAMGAEGCGHMVAAIDAAVRQRCPVVGVWHRAAAALAEAVDRRGSHGDIPL